MSKQTLAQWNRWLGWITVPVVVAAFATRYIWDWREGDMRGLYITIQTLVGILPLVHFALSLFLFGFPRGGNAAKTRHVYIGYGVFLAIMISQSLIGTGIVYDITTWAMYLLIVVHVVLGYRHAQARQKSGGDPMSEVQRGRKAAA